MVELAAWLVTLAIHSSVMLGAVWVSCTVCVRLPERVREVLWKAAAFGALPTSLLQHWWGAAPAAGYVAVLGTPAVVEIAPVAGSAEPSPVEALAMTAPVCFATLAIALAILASARVLVQCWRARRLLRDRQPAPAALVAELATVRERCGGRHARLTVSRTLRVPIATGVLRPEICLPAAIATLDDSERRAVLAHEFGHLLRRDPLWLRAFLVAQCLLPWQPLLRLARRRVEELSEYACDALAAELAGVSGTARCLVAVADWLRAAPATRCIVAASMAAKGSLLARRVDRLLSERGVAGLGRHGWWLAPGIGLLLATAAVALPAAAFVATPPATLPRNASPLERAAALLDAECAALSAEFARLQRELPVAALEAADRALLQRLAARIAALDANRVKIAEAVRALDAPAAASNSPSPR